MSNGENNVERMKRVLEDQVRERLERRVLTRINCDPPVATVHDTIVVRADVIVPPNVELRLKPVVRCAEVEGFRKQMLKRKSIRAGEEFSFEARFHGRELGAGAFRLPVYASPNARDPVGVGTIELFTTKEVAVARREVYRVLLARSRKIASVKSPQRLRPKPRRGAAKRSQRQVPRKK
jgi:hypothetical protein